MLVCDVYLFVNRQLNLLLETAMLSHRASRYCRKDQNEGSQDRENVTGMINMTRMIPVARSHRSLFPVFYDWEKQAGEVCNISANIRSQDLWDTHGRCLRGSVCGDQPQSRKNCSEAAATRRLTTCKNCGCAMFGRHDEEVCCRMIINRLGSLRIYLDTILEELCQQRYS